MHATCAVLWGNFVLTPALMFNIDFVPVFYCFLFTLVFLNQNQILPLFWMGILTVLNL